MSEENRPRTTAPGEHRWWRPAWLTTPLVLLLVTTVGALAVLGGTDVSIVASLRNEVEDDRAATVIAPIREEVLRLRDAIGRD